MSCSSPGSFIPYGKGYPAPPHTVPIQSTFFHLSVCIARASDGQCRVAPGTVEVAFEKTYVLHPLIASAATHVALAKMTLQKQQIDSAAVTNASPSPPMVCPGAVPDAT